MPPREIAGRVSDLGTRVLEEQLHRLGLDANPDPKLVDAAAPRFPYPFFQTTALEAVTDALRTDDGYVRGLLSEAEALVRGEFSFFGQSFQLPPTRIPWTSDPVSGRPWPMVFHTKVDIFSGNVGHGDVKFVWELNRHQFLPTLGKAWRLTGDARYPELALAWIEEWIETNPYKVGINWASALELAVRSLSWLWAAALFDNAPAFSEARRHLLRRSLHQHAEFLASHLSYYFSPYNHLIGEATALHAIGTLVPSLDRARAWRDLGWRIMCSEVGTQLHPDGGTVEQAFGYHHFTLGFYLQSLLIAQAHGQHVPPRVEGRLAAAWRFSAAITRPDGQVPMVGDADEGKALALDQAHLWDFRSYQAVGAAVLADAALAAAAGPCPADARWVIGARPWPASSAPAAQSELLALNASGYTILRDTERAHWLLFDTGDIAHGVPEDDEVSAAHGHADLLAFELTAAGRPRLVDPGFLTYNGPVEWHRYFRDTHAHNALVIDDESQARYRGRLKWSHGATARRTCALAADAFAYVEGEHDAYRRGSHQVTHARGIVWARPDTWIVLDWLTGEGDHLVDRYFHFAPGETTAHASGAWGAFENGVALGVHALEHDAECTLLCGGDAPDAGWVATRYEQKVPAAVLRIRARRPVPGVVATLLTASDGTAAPTWRREDGGLRIGWPDGGALLLAWAGDAAHGPLDTDARCAATAISADGSITAALMVHGTRLAYAGRSLYTTPAPADVVLAPAGTGMVPVQAHILR